MDAAAGIGKNSVSNRFRQSIEMSKLTRDGTAEPVSRDQILRRERGQGNFHFLCSADHEQDWQPYPVDPYSAIICDDHTYIHRYDVVCWTGQDQRIRQKTTKRKERKAIKKTNTRKYR